ncbi:MAG: glycosyl hydrolase-related protein [Lachnospiraceae bacterium]
MLETIKRAEDGDGWIARLYEARQRPHRHLPALESSRRLPWRSATASRRRKRTLPSKTARISFTILSV